LIDMLRASIVPLAVALAAGCAATPEDGTTPAGGPHAINVLVGGSFDRAGDGVALGASYEYRKSPQLGIGAFGDVAFAHETSTVLGGAVFVHPADRWTLFAGPGVEFIDGDSDMIARVGGSYLVPAHDVALGPAAWVDIGGGASVFVGLSVGFRW
jgi:hypothetical protein